ncbi:MAG: ComF family protein [Nitratireductor sp.]|nr:ComF family protein [Nitratireductor sp.]
MLQGALRGARRVADFAVPPQCLMCDALTGEPGGCCARCWKRLRFIEAPICPVSGRPFAHDMGEGVLSPEVIAAPPPYDRARAAILYDDHSRLLVTRLKYADRLDLAPWMARWMVRAGRELLEPGAILVPVPLHPLRRLKRRCNQSAELARAIARGTGLVMRPDFLVRARRTRQQVGLTGGQRKRNVAGAFRPGAGRAVEIAGRHIVLVDDVYTSGATVRAACHALKRAGARQVDVLTFARVDASANPALYDV